MKYRLLALTLIAIAVTGLTCELPVPNWERGDFHPDPGRGWDLPANLRVNSILGWEDETPASLLPLALALSNTGTSRVTVTMPAGLCFKPRSPDYQYMILLQDFTFTVPDDDTTVIVPTWCANEDLDEPDDESVYDIDLVAWDREMKELYDLLKGKTIVDSIIDLDLLQDALWEITDGGGLTEGTRTWLTELP